MMKFLSISFLLVAFEKANAFQAKASTSGARLPQLSAIPSDRRDFIASSLIAAGGILIGGKPSHAAGVDYKQVAQDISGLVKVSR